jgi:glycosyltransferase involved in cell wall biosynthesis
MAYGVPPAAVMPAARQRILLVVYGPIAERMSAPEIRGWEMAKVLARRHAVTVAAPGALQDGRDGIRMVPADRRTLLREARQHDVLIVPRVPPYLLAGVSTSRTLVAADLYNPFEEEHAELTSSRAIRRQIEATRVANRMQLRFADVVLCAVEPQRERLVAALDALGDRRRRPAVEVVAFGIPDDPPASDRRPMRAAFPAIGADDVVILWWGNVWRWFDAPTALEAFRRLAAERPGVRLVLTAGRHPRQDWPVLEHTEQARELARSMGLLGESVFFLEDWVPQEERHHYLLEADVGVTLHRATAETEVAARGRYMDYLWAGLPCVLGGGDPLADRFAGAGFALTVAPGDVDGAHAALRRLVTDGEERGRRREAAAALKEEFRWPATVQPLLAALDAAAGSRPAHRGRPLALARDLAEYYARKALSAATPGAPEPGRAADEQTAASAATNMNT